MQSVKQLVRGHLTSVLYTVWSVAVIVWSLISSAAVRIRSCLFSMEAHVLQIDCTRLPEAEVSAKAVLTLSPSSSSSLPISLLPFPPSLALFPPRRTTNNEASVKLNLLTCSSQFCSSVSDSLVAFAPTLAKHHSCVASVSGPCTHLSWVFGDLFAGSDPGLGHRQNTYATNFLPPHWW